MDPPALQIGLKPGTTQLLVFNSLTADDLRGRPRNWTRIYKELSQFLEVSLHLYLRASVRPLVHPSVKCGQHWIFTDPRWIVQCSSIIEVKLVDWLVGWSVSNASVKSTLIMPLFPFIRMVIHSQTVKTRSNSHSRTLSVIQWNSNQLKNEYNLIQLNSFWFMNECNLLPFVWT